MERSIKVKMAPFTGVASFRSYNEKVVKCVLKVFVDEDSSSYGEHIGIAKCNFDAGDSFSESEGQRIALEKALQKFHRAMETEARDLNRTIYKTDKQAYRLDVAVHKRLEKTQKKARKNMKTAQGDLT